jgi:hypothetical protein
MTEDDFEVERDRRRRLVDEARETVSRLTAAEERWREEFEQLPPIERAERLVGAPEDPGERWRAEMDTIAAERERARAEIAAAKPALPDWDAIDVRIQSAIEYERRLLCEVLGTETAKLLAEERKSTLKEARDELRELKIEIAKYASEVAALREALAVDRGKPVDLPSPLARRVN